MGGCIKKYCNFSTPPHHAGIDSAVIQGARFRTCGRWDVDALHARAFGHVETTTWQAGRIS